MLKDVNNLVVQVADEKALRKKSGESLRARVDSFAVETDVSLLWDAIRSSWNSTARLCAARRVAGLRQSKHVLNGMMASFQTVRRFKGWSDRKKVRAYLPRARMMTERKKSAHAELRLQALSSVQKASLNAQETMVAMAEKLMDQVTRRLLKGEKIPQEEKIFSVFEPHTRWIANGNAAMSTRRCRWSKTA